MIISASRRTDIPAFFAPWLMKRLRAGYCTTVNPFNAHQVSYVSLRPDDVEAIVFWTKNFAPLLPYLEELQQHRFYVQYTVNAYGPLWEQQVPLWEESVETFARLAGAIGPERVIWRYDPIVLSSHTPLAWHEEHFGRLLAALAPHTRRLVVSLVDDYRKAGQNFRRLREQGVEVQLPKTAAEAAPLLHFMAREAQSRGLVIQSCAETFDLSPYGIGAGRCVDDGLIYSLFGLETPGKKDPFQRKECGCVVSKDIGAYDTCRHGCLYCYAGTLAAGRRAQERHQEDASSLLGWHDAPLPAAKETQPRMAEEQGTLF